MAINSALIDEGAAGIASAVTYISLHSADPGSSGANETSAARQAVTATHSGGAVSIGSTAFTGVAASGDVKYVGFWDAATSGTFYGSAALTGDQAANAAGEYTVDSVTITGTAN